MDARRLAPRLLAVVLAAAASAPARAGPAEAAFQKCWQKEVSTACNRLGREERTTVDECTAEFAKTKCLDERDAYEKELAAGLAADVLELLAASIKKVCGSEAQAAATGRPDASKEDEIAAGWREALQVRSEFMKACERSGREARECDERASDAERNARAQSCAAPTAAR
ncbi:MAG TPA: hypothetical protein VFL83_23325 [Anaeromyxobacter sp.]|nr:hypothetical protein [Anaeromyxobacter sp.]